MKDLLAATQIERAIELIIRSHARLLGDEWAIGMHVEALNGDMTMFQERSRDLRWLNAQDNTGAADISGGAPDDVNLITSALSDEETLCACLAEKTSIPMPRLDPVLWRIRARRLQGRCGNCLNTRQTVYRLA